MRATPVYLSVYDVEGPDGFAQLTLAVYPEDGVCCVTSYVQAIPSTTRPSTFNDLSFEGKGWLHYVMFGLLIGMPLFLVGTAILCFVEKRVRRRWLWIPFILIGLWGVQFNWTTGVLTPELDPDRAGWGAIPDYRHSFAWCTDRDLWPIPALAADDRLPGWGNCVPDPAPAGQTRRRYGKGIRNVF
jgi:hypothetical protein